MTETGCREFGKGLEPYLDGELEPDASMALEAHVASCRSCSAELEVGRAVRRGLRGLPRFEAPTATVDALLAAVRRENDGRSPARPRLRPMRLRPAWLALAAALLMALALVWSVNRRSDSVHRQVALDDPAVVRATLETKLALAHFARANRRIGEEILRVEAVHEPDSPGARSGPPESVERG